MPRLCRQDNCFQSFLEIFKVPFATNVKLSWEILSLIFLRKDKNFFETLSHVMLLNHLYSQDLLITKWSSAHQYTSFQPSFALPSAHIIPTTSSSLKFKVSSPDQTIQTVRGMSLREGRKQLFVYRWLTQTFIIWEEKQ